MYTKADAIRDADRAMASYGRQRDLFLEEADDIRRSMDRLKLEQRETVQELAEKLLSRPARDQVERVCAEIGSTKAQGVLHRAEHTLDQMNRRLPQIEADEAYAQRGTLLHPEQGPHLLARAEAAEDVARHEAATAAYDFKAFHWLFAKGFHLAPAHTGFQSFMRAVVLTPWREKRALAEVQKRLGNQPFEALAQQFEAAAAALEEAQGRHQHWDDKIRHILDLMAERDALLKKIEDHPAHTLGDLHTSIAATLQEADLAHVHDRIRPAARPLVARASALGKKLTYLDDLVTYLRREVGDRERRVASIDRVAKKWRRKPYGLTRSKKRWLVTLPEAKMQSTQKRLGFVRTIRHNVVGFNDYNGYSVLMHEMGGALLAYDVFGMAAGTHMPYEKLSRTLIPELDLYRETFRQSAPDYRGYRRIVHEHDTYVETDWEVWDEDDYYEDQVAESMAAEWTYGQMLNDLS